MKKSKEDFLEIDPVFENDLILVPKSWNLGIIRISSLCSLRTQYEKPFIVGRIQISTVWGSAGR